MKVDHIGIAVKDLQDTLNLYKRILEDTESEIKEAPSEKVRVAMVPVGDTRIELLEPMSKESAVAVEDIKESIGRLSTEGLRVLYPEPRPGSHGKMIAFLYPKSTKGVLLELCQLQMRRC